MAVIAIASDKGGVSKTSLALLVGAEAALDGYRACILDSDINQQAAAFGAKGKVPGLTVIGDIDETNILAALRRAEAEADIVIVDLPGGASALALKAFHRSHFVLIPAQPSMPDVKAAMKTIAQIDDAQELARAPIARSLVWTRIMPGYESVPVRQVRAAMEESADVPIFRTALMERAAFRDIHISGLVPRQKDPTGELLESVAKLKVNAA
jgi:chromosome partitioning protein